MSKRILVIKLGALGDLILCRDAFAAIRAAHPRAHIALLTTKPFAAFGAEMPWFDEVIIDPRAKAKNLRTWMRFLEKIDAFKPTHVFDFQGKPRQTALYYLLGGPLNKGMKWSGAAFGCTWPRPWPPKPETHYMDFLASQLETAGIETDEKADMAWLDDSLEEFNLPEKFVLLIPGCASSRSYKRWPPLHYASLAKNFGWDGVKAITVGTEQDKESIRKIRALAPEVIDLSGKTSLKQLAAIARRAKVVIGNDTGPTHIAAAVGARTLALMSDHVDPHWSAPRGPHTKWLQGVPLSDLGVEEVWEMLRHSWKGLIPKEHALPAEF